MNNTQRHRLRSPLLIPGREFTIAELSAAALDGELVRIAGSFLPIDVPVTVHDRAAVIGVSTGDRRVIVSDLSAAWVRGWTDSFAAVTTSTSVTARIPSTERRRLRTREVVIDDDEWVSVGALRVTTATRTLLDLARHGNDDVVGVLAAGIVHERIDPESITRALDRRPTASYQKRARERLARALELSRC